LAVLLPEIDRLFGVPQTARHHPEIDTGVHTMMVIDMAADLDADNATCFAALCHDLGKASSPASNLPRHIAHETKGLSLINALCDRLRIPSAHRQLAALACQYHTHCHRAKELKASTIAKVLESLDIFRRPQRLEDFLIACEADARGRLGFENAPYPQADVFRLSANAARQVDIRDLVSNGTSGKEIKKQLRIRRTKAIAEVLKKDRSDT
ncbi:MAG: HD domain-containing protein, partial [Gammaproteobacteria bacterium]|nr:HD domain-containing protein [Gammaproteobacteria bacterium]